MSKVLSSKIKNPCFEMATLRKRRSGLPVNLYLDDSGAYLNGKHAPRIKFQNNTNDSANTRNMIPMTIEDSPKIPIRNYRQQLDGITDKDIEYIKEFVKNNKDNLLRLCNRDDPYDIEDFIDDMIIEH